uniref:Cytochrome b n=1 Tax=Leptopilina syphax TaxID=2755057 RepID=A0A7D6FMG4_9HYME|nr:cytochrome b [Leptopilina syphax]
MMMKMIFYKSNLKKELLYLPTPININLMWNFGFLLGMCLSVQILSGIFLTMYYNSSVDLAFESVIHIIHDVNYGWVIRLIHMNGASFFFICLFMHIGRGLYMSSYKMIIPWLSGSVMFLMIMGAAFLGYVLPWGQMSFWGATVITNLVSAIPFIGNDIVIWLWGGFSVGAATLSRFYSFHFILPLVILLIVLVHLASLHTFGSSNPLGVSSDLNKIPFHKYFLIKDLLVLLIMVISMLLINCLNPYVLGDPENFNLANPMVTPIHIQPEWYFLFAYAILRSIPSKLGGVMALGASVLILVILPFFSGGDFMSEVNYPFNQILYWLFINFFILLTWIGMKPIEYPYMEIGQILSVMYFMYFFLNYMFKKSWNLFME